MLIRWLVTVLHKTVAALKSCLILFLQGNKASVLEHRDLLSDNDTNGLRGEKETVL